MKILDISQSQDMYKIQRSPLNGDDKSEDAQNIFEKMPEAEVVISQEGLVAWAEEIKKRTGNIGMLTGWEDTSQYAVGAKNEVSFEHLMELGKVREEVRSNSYKNGNGVDITMKSLLEAYEIVYNKIIEQHKTGNREVKYLTGFRSVSLEEDLEALDEAYDQWLVYLDAHVLVQQRIKAIHLKPPPERENRNKIKESEYQSQYRKKYDKKFMTEEYHEYRRNITVMMNQGRQELLAAFKTPGEKVGLAKSIITNLMNNCPGFWTKTRELWPDTK